MNALELIFLGHQSWWVRHGDVSILVDPILESELGNRTRLPVHPPRRVDVAALRLVDMVVLTHEHNDHVDLRSMALLDRSVPVLVAPLMPAVVVRALKRLGFKVHRAVPEAALTAGGLQIQMLPGGEGAPVGEGRVAQVLLSAKTTHGDVCVLMGVDTVISDLTIDGMHDGRLPAPDVVVVSNNTQIPPPGVHGSARDLLARDPHEAFLGLELLRDLCVDYLAGVPGSPAVVLCGGGFVDTHELGVPYWFDDHRALEGLARTLAPGRKVFGPIPGASLRIRATSGGVDIKESSSAVVRVDQKALQAMRGRVAPEGGLPLSSVLPFLPAEEVPFAVETVLSELDRLVPALLAHPFGRVLLECHHHDGRWLGPKRLLVHLICRPDGAGIWQALDLAESRFLPVELSPAADVLREWPFGFELCLQDLFALFRGELVVWDVFGVAMRHWSVDPTALAGVLCELLGEGARPAATAVSLAHQLSMMGIPTDPEDLLLPSPGRGV